MRAISRIALLRQFTVMKYEAQIQQLKDKLGQANKVLIVLPEKVSDDLLGAALAFYLSLRDNHKPVSIVSSGEMTGSSFIGSDEISNHLQKAEGGNLVLTLEGVVDESGKVTSLEKLDWYPEGRNLNLVFHVLSGQTFEPKSISTMRQGSEYDLVVIVGAATPANLGELFIQNGELFYKATKVNIDNSSNNSLFGQINIVDTGETSLSQMMFQIMSGLGLPFTADSATNIISGILSATHNLQNNTNSETFLAIGSAMQVGGKMSPSNVSAPATDIESNSIIHPRKEASNGNVTVHVPAVNAPTINPDPTPSKEVTETQNPPAQEEIPLEEQATSTTPEGVTPTPDWLTPKVYKGRSV